MKNQPTAHKKKKILLAPAAVADLRVHSSKSLLHSYNGDDDDDVDGCWRSMSFACGSSQKFRQYTATFNGFCTYVSVCVCECVYYQILSNITRISISFGFLATITTLKRSTYRCLYLILSLSPHISFSLSLFQLRTQLLMHFWFSRCVSEILAKNTFAFRLFSSKYFSKCIPHKFFDCSLAISLSLRRSPSFHS